jgi:hypothetical protein
MKASDFFSGKYLTANELPKERHLTMVITSVTEETMQLTSETKLVARFSSPTGKAARKGVVLNTTNGKALSAVFGDDTDLWVGQRVEMWAAPTTFAGKATLGIKLMPIGNGHSAPTPTPVLGEAGSGDLDDEIPFSPRVQ